jgi:orotidine-5'-phosphate decarboxylase
LTHFADRLTEAVQRTGNAVCVGLDPRWDNLPESLRSRGAASSGARADAFTLFCHGVIDVVASLVPVVKIQSAFFEALGPNGMASMAEVISYAEACGLLVILDGKRNDIGSTAEAYARGYLGREGSLWHADALTVSPYLGDDSLTPFADVAKERDAGIFVLVKTSNPGGKFLQDLTCDGELLYRRVGAHVEQLAAANVGECGFGAVGAVVGATYPEQLVELRAAMPHTWFLVPGYGSQGGRATDVVPALDANGMGAIINNSRNLIFAHERKEYAKYGAARWQEAVEAATRRMIDEIISALPEEAATTTE